MNLTYFLFLDAYGGKCIWNKSIPFICSYILRWKYNIVYKGQEMPITEHFGFKNISPSFTYHYLSCKTFCLKCYTCIHIEFFYYYKRKKKQNVELWLFPKKVMRCFCFLWKHFFCKQVCWKTSIYGVRHLSGIKL